MTPTSSAKPAEQDTTGPGFSLPRTARLITRRDFRLVYSRGRRARGRDLVVVALKCDRPRHEHRLGLAVSKDHGRAVRRNKIKRILREAFRLTRPDLPGAYDIVLIPQQRPGKYLLLRVQSELRSLLEQIESGKGRRRRRRS